MDQHELLERLADAEHDSWSRWMRYLFSKCSKQPDGGITIPAELVQHWQRQLETHYDQLSEREKESDREEVRRILPVIEQYARARRERVEAALRAFWDYESEPASLWAWDEIKEMVTQALADPAGGAGRAEGA